MSFVKIKKEAVRMAFAVVGSLFLGSARLNAQEIKLYDPQIRNYAPNMIQKRK